VGDRRSHGFIQGHTCKSGRRQCLFLLQVILGLTLFPSSTQGESGYMLHCHCPFKSWYFASNWVHEKLEASSRQPIFFFVFLTYMHHAQSHTVLMGIKLTIP